MLIKHSFSLVMLNEFGVCSWRKWLCLLVVKHPKVTFCRNLVCTLINGHMKLINCSAAKHRHTVSRYWVSCYWHEITQEMMPLGFEQGFLSMCAFVWLQACKQHFLVFHISAKCSVAIIIYHSSPKIVQIIVLEASLTQFNVCVCEWLQCLFISESGRPSCHFVWCGERWELREIAASAYQ